VGYRKQEKPERVRIKDTNSGLHEKQYKIPTKSFVEIEIKYFITTKCLALSTKRSIAAAKFLVAATKKLFVVHTFVAATKPFFP